MNTQEGVEPLLHNAYHPLSMLLELVFFNEFQIIIIHLFSFDKIVENIY